MQVQCEKHAAVAQRLHEQLQQAKSVIKVTLLNEAGKAVEVSVTIC